MACQNNLLKLYIHVFEDPEMDSTSVSFQHFQHIEMDSKFNMCSVRTEQSSCTHVVICLICACAVICLKCTHVVTCLICARGSRDEEMDEVS